MGEGQHTKPTDLCGGAVSSLGLSGGWWRTAEQRHCRQAEHQPASGIDQTIHQNDSSTKHSLPLI
jgi:hypothetical protein